MIVWRVMKNFWVALQACSIVRGYISQSFQEKPQGLRRSVQKNQAEALKQMQYSRALSYILQVSRKQPFRLQEIMVSKICLVTKEAKQVKKPRGCEVLARQGRPEDASWVAQANENTFFIQATMFREKFVQFHLKGIQV